MLDEFRKNGIDILKVYLCPHSPEDNCMCRKPNTGMIEKAMKDFDIDLRSSWLIGDKISDIQTAKNAGIPKYILIDSKYLDENNTKDIKYIVKNMNKCKEIIND